MPTPEDQIPVPDDFRYAHSAIVAYRAGYLAREREAAEAVVADAPPELWALRALTVMNDEFEAVPLDPAEHPGRFVPPIDEPGVDVFMVVTSEDDARTLAAHQKSLCDIDAVPVRIK